MDRQEYYDRLDSTADSPSELFEHFDTRSAEDHTYHALPDDRHGVERGTVVVEDADAVVRGYPSVPRVLVLDPGMPKFFDSDGTPFVEEKLDGFNVRIAEVGDVLAFTRSGYVCPYTTGRARELLEPSSFFSDHPEKVVCAELIGPETPYTTHDYDDIDSHEFRVFDVRDRETGAPLPVSDRRDLCSEYGFDQPRLFGRFDTDDLVTGVQDAIADLDDRDREGVVVKSPDGTSMVKYTTESQHHAELADAFSLPFEYGRDFLFSRIVRDAFQAAELDESEDRLRERARDLGESVLIPMVETIDAVANGDPVGERRTVRGDSDRIDALLDHLRDQSLTLEVTDDRREGGERVLEFIKVAESTRDRTDYYVDGGTRDE